MVIHHASIAHVERLERIFAKLTSQGWVIPDWLKLMRATAKF